MRLKGANDILAPRDRQDGQAVFPKNERKLERLIELGHQPRLFDRVDLRRGDAEGAFRIYAIQDTVLLKQQFPRFVDTDAFAAHNFILLFKEGAKSHTPSTFFTPVADEHLIDRAAFLRLGVDGTRRPDGFDGVPGIYIPNKGGVGIAEQALDPPCSHILEQIPQADLLLLVEIVGLIAGEIGVCRAVVGRVEIDERLLVRILHRGLKIAVEQGDLRAAEIAADGAQAVLVKNSRVGIPPIGYVKQALRINPVKPVETGLVEINQARGFFHAGQTRKGLIDMIAHSLVGAH